MTPENTHKTIAIIGAPCAGKTRVLQELESFAIKKYRQRWVQPHKDTDPYYYLAHETWDNYDPFAHMLLEYLKKLGEISKTTITEMKEGMKDEVVWSFNHRISDQDGEITRTGDITLLDIYYLLGFTFLDTTGDSITTIAELRRIMQLDLLSAQLLKEAEWSLQAHGQNRVTIMEGGPINTVTYLPKIRMSYFQPTLAKFGDRSKTPAQLAQRYHHVFLLETLAVLPEKEYERYFYDGIRLDEPENARTMNQRLSRNMKDVPNMTMLPATMSLGEKVAIVRNKAQIVGERNI